MGRMKHILMDLMEKLFQKDLEEGRISLEMMSGEYQVQLQERAAEYYSEMIESRREI